VFLQISESHEMDLVTAIEQIIVPVLQAMTKPGEVESLALTWAPPTATVTAPGPPSVLLLEVVLRGEQFQSFVWASSDPPSSPAGIRARLASDLQDFVAESRFAWGELRPYDVE